MRLALFFVRCPDQLANVHVEASPARSLEVAVKDLWIRTDNVLPFPVLDQVQTLQRAQDVIRFYRRHVAKLLHTSEIPC